MAKVGYIMKSDLYEYLEEDIRWMNEFGCVNVFEEEFVNEHTRPLWKQLMVSLNRGDTLVISKFSNALRGSRELAIFLEFCRVKVIRLISIHDQIDSKNELFPETKPADVLLMVGSLPHEALALRKSASHNTKLQKQIKQTERTTEPHARRLEREQTVVNMYASGHSISDIWTASGYKSRSSIFRILNKYNILLDRGNHSGPLSTKKEK